MSLSSEICLANKAAGAQAVATARMAKYADQPYNTKRMYVGYQKEWKNWCEHHQYEDGAIVRESKLVRWLQEDVLQRRHLPLKSKKRKRDSKPTEKALTDKAKDLVAAIQAPVKEALALLIDDCILAVTKSPSGADEVVVGALYQAATIEVYVAGVMELYTA